MPIIVKINIDIAGTLSTGSMPGFADWRPSTTAPVVTQLLEAGAIVVAKTNMPEAAFGPFSFSPLHGLTLNPKNSLENFLKKNLKIKKFLKFEKIYSDRKNYIQDYIHGSIVYGAGQTGQKLLKHYKETKNNSISSDDEYYNIFENQAKNKTLREYLIESLGIFSFSERQQIILSFLIDAINDEGYLTETFESLIDSIPQEPMVES